MTLEENLAAMNKWFDSKSPRDLLKMRYEHDLEAIPKFNADLLKEAIDKQLCLGDEECFYSKDPEIHKFAELWTAISSVVSQHLPFQNIEESVFPLEFFIVENNGKKSVISFMHSSQKSQLSSAFDPARSPVFTLRQSSATYPTSSLLSIRLWQRSHSIILTFYPPPHEISS